jgi:hypothetical protein
MSKIPKNSKKQSESSSSSEEESSPKVVLSKAELKKALKEKLELKRLARLAPAARDNKITELELKLKQIGDKDPKQSEKIKNKIDLLQTANEIQIDTSTGEYPEYADNGGYGGGIERGD